MYLFPCFTKVEYRLKWVGYSARYNSWEPEGHFNCNELIAEFEQARAKQILGKYRLISNVVCFQFQHCVGSISGVAKRGREVIYVLKFNDVHEPCCVPSAEARLCSNLIFDYFIDRLEWNGSDIVNKFSLVDFLNDDYRSQEQPEIICTYFYEFRKI